MKVTSPVATWRINPLVKALATRHMVQDSESGACLAPEAVPHCHGVEIQHANGLAECMTFDSECQAPGPGQHVHVHRCEPELASAALRGENTAELPPYNLATGPMALGAVLITMSDGHTEAIRRVE